MRAVDEARAAAVVRSLMAALDAADFEAARRQVSRVVEMDYVGLWDDGPLTLSADDLLASWRSVIPGFDAVRHDLAEFSVAVGGRRAEVICSADVRHYLDEDVWRICGGYRIGLKRATPWRIETMRFSITKEQGDRRLIEQARRRALRLD